ncbi:MAG TPA: hypothetical protein VFI47_30475 [Acidimicrobiales bacterium]|nr:hypothetical protein [Acidimicrobiales bacterium]
MPVRRAQRHDLARLPAIGTAAGERFRSIGDPRIARCADDPPWTVPELDDFLATGALWVATARRGPTGDPARPG